MKNPIEYVIVHKTDHTRFQGAINEYAAEGFTMVGPAGFFVDGDEERHYIATMERKVEAREEGEV